MSSGRTFRFLLAGFLLTALQSSLRGQSGATVELMTVTPAASPGAPRASWTTSAFMAQGRPTSAPTIVSSYFPAHPRTWWSATRTASRTCSFRDRSTGVTSLVSVNSTGGPGNRQSGQAVISATADMSRSSAWPPTSCPATRISRSIPGLPDRRQRLRHLRPRSPDADDRAGERVVGGRRSGFGHTSRRRSARMAATSRSRVHRAISPRGTPTFSTWTSSCTTWWPARRNA